MISERVASGPCQFHILVPEPAGHRPALMEGAEFDDPTIPVMEEDDTAVSGADLALRYLYTELDRLHHTGIEATGEVCDNDPVETAKALVAKQTVDEIILSTLPAGISRWLHRDLPSRLQRAVPVPVTVLIGSQEDSDRP
jgi:GABA permease